MSISTRPTKSEALTISTKGRLTKKENLFVTYFLQGNSPHKSAQLAGYSPFTCEVAASIILNRPKVIAEIRKQTNEVFKEKSIDQDWVIQRAAELAESNMLDYLQIDDQDGKVTVDLRRATRSMGAAIQELSYDPSGRLKIRLVDKKASVELLARIKKMFNDSDETSKGEAPLTIQALDRIVQNVTINQQVNVIQSQERHQLPELVGQV